MAGSVQPPNFQHAASIHFPLKPAIDKWTQNPSSPAEERCPSSFLCFWEDLVLHGREVALTPPRCEQAS